MFGGIVLEGIQLFPGQGRKPLMACRIRSPWNFWQLDGRMTVERVGLDQRRGS